MKYSDFYGNPADAGGVASAAPLEVPPEGRAIGGKPVYFWLAMVALLVAARLAYELSSEVK